MFSLWARVDIPLRLSLVQQGLAILQIVRSTLKRKVSVCAIAAEEEGVQMGNKVVTLLPAGREMDCACRGIKRYV